MELVRRCADGEAAAWDEIVRRHVALLHAVVARIVAPGRSAANDPETEDVVQAVYLKLWEDGRRRLKTFRGESRLSTWLVVLARREALDRVRGRQRAAGAAPGTAYAKNGHVEAVEKSLSAEAAFASGEERDRLLAAIDVLPPRDRLLVRLVHLDGCAYGEVARLLQVAENSISPWLARARDRLRTALTERGGHGVYGSRIGEPLTGRSETT